MYIAKAYYDTGNILRDMSGRPVLICNSFLAMKLLGTAYKDIIDSYTTGNCFNYKCANLISSIYFQPIPYRTVSTGFSMLPGFAAQSLTYLKSQKIYHDIVIAIAPYDMTLGDDINILLNDSIKP